MTNELLFVVSLVAAFSSIVVAARLFGKAGLTTIASICAVVANIITVKQVSLFGIDVSMGAILFSCVYLCTDIISEVAGKQESRKTVVISLFSVIFTIVTMQMVMLFKPNEYDLLSTQINDVFGLSTRICIASVVMFFMSNIADVYLFEAIKKRFPKQLWLRNNVATIVCNCLENFLFILGAFIGVYTIDECIYIALSTCIIECIVAICDTPFVYMGVKLIKKENNNSIVA